MDVGANQKYAKYAIKYRKALVIPENHEESTHSGLCQQFHLQQQYFLRNIRNDDAQAFQYL